MDVTTYHVGVVSRGNGRSAVQVAAYNARSKLHNDYNGMSYDYTKKHDLVYHEILLPDHAPDAFYKQSILWNAVEQKEKNRNSRLARAVYFALPKKLERETHIDMTRDYVRDYFVDRGMCADVSVHDKGDGNPHVHVLLTTRSLNENGEWMGKQHRNYLLDENGERIRDPQTNQYMLGKSIKIVDWDNTENVELWRSGWAAACNYELERMGFEKRVTHLSYARQGIDLEPTKHLGARVKALEDRGIPTDRGNENRAIKARNKARERQRRRERSRERSREHERTFERSR